MADTVSPKVRSRMMSGIRAKNTKPEMIVRRGLHRAGFRYVLHDRRLPGRPDIVLPRHHAVVFVNGCFWHGHGCRLFRIPATRPEFWSAKIGQNRARDVATRAALAAADWRVATILECTLRGNDVTCNEVISRLEKWISSRSVNLEIPA